MNYQGITLRPERDARLSAQAVDLLQGFYCKNGETIQEAFARPALAYCGGDLELAQAIYDDVSRGWAMYSSPIQSNAPAVGEKPKGQPISCFLSYVPDTREGLVDHQNELAWMAMSGGGVGGHWDDIRSVSDLSVGVIPHLKYADSAVDAFRQGKTRKGAYAAYLDVSHPDMVEFLSIRMPTGGDINRKCFNLHQGVNITDEFMAAVFADSEWTFRCPHTGTVTDTVNARELWQSILETRFSTGEPYLNFIDTANRFLPEAQKRLGLTIKGSNLCNEIHLATNAIRSAVCCLSSVNLEMFDEWSNDPQFISRWIRFLDNVLEAFIENAPVYLRKAIYSASRERSIGLGAMGFHSLLQKKGIAWESPMAISLNRRIFKKIKEEAVDATRELAASRGEAPDMIGTGRRNAHLLAIAPNANSGLICGTSPSIEPLRSNAFVQRTRAGSHLMRNPHLKPVLEKYGQDNEETWRSIVLNQGSVQHLEFLNDYEKDVFKTAFELDMRWTVNHAADRQEFICQGQSVNVYFPHGSPRHYVNQVHLQAYQRGLKGLYYLRTTSGFNADKVSEKIERKALKDFNANSEEECLACQG